MSQLILNNMALATEPSLKNLTSNFGKVPEKQNEILQSLGAPHVDSFNYFLGDGIKKAVADILPMEFSLPSNERICIRLENVQISPPAVPPGTLGVKSATVYPSECRQRGASYKGQLTAEVSWTVNGISQGIIEKDLGRIPILIKSDACHLSKLSPQQLIEKGEHAEEWGGYFVIRGHERLIRMLHMTRRNYPITISRPSWKMRGDSFSELGVLIRCVKEDQTSMNNVLHFVKNGSVKMMFNYQRSLYFVPIMLILKSLLDVTDEFILQQALAGFEENAYFKGCLINMLRAIHDEYVHTHIQAKEYIGQSFRVKFQMLPAWKTDAEICDFIIDSLSVHVHVLMHVLCCVNAPVVYWFGTDILNQIFRRSGNLESTLEAFLATGNLVTHSGLGLQQDKGLTIVCENINRMRYMSHFRAVHRGSFFQEMRSSEPRQLLPDAWGFICPVHTPDGTPCGLLNHLSKLCEVTPVPDPELVANIPSVLVALGMIPKGGIGVSVHHSRDYVVMLDGRVLGYVEKEEAPRLVCKLRLLKIAGLKVPKTLEIALVPLLRKCGQYPGLFLFTGPARMMRPVINLAAGKIELIGTFEQVYMDICVYPEEAHAETTHQEVSDTSFLSHLACLIPMPDCNQSPRNMYQCQMGKQTMGTPCHNWLIQADTKVYRLQTPMSPFFRPFHYDLVGLDEFAMGTNAMVAVISYTGYDMEDAMIINKASYDRGFGHGSVYKSEFIELKEPQSYFCLDPNKPDLQEFLDSDGLPHPGVLLKEGQPICCYYNGQEMKYYIEKWKSKEVAYVDNVRLCGTLGTKELVKACIVVRIPRKPTVGDKFASRAGQKGICSYLWPAEDLPYTETGIIPDIVFNPHGFPSRMTIAMMIEVMAGKSAALHGLVHDATPFRFSEKDTAIDYFGKLLEAAGYNYYSTEKMYSGIDGRELNAEIFFGVVHYQRLRHMVSDKWQVRSTGPIDALTHQPVKGRRKGGGIRFGEMERDSLLSHGASFLLQDRLFHCSDKTSCGNILSPIVLAQHRDSHLNHLVRCQICREDGDVQEMDIPYIFRYLVAQLASVNIKILIDVVEH
ncbi:DNA-directed RNA polymerase I subunit RPA2 [Blattella germanica]|nr:DNA-directed RNA polymerase I subunit RPA2 [Blattella germanica]